MNQTNDTNPANNTIVDREEPTYDTSSAEGLARVSEIACSSMGNLLEVDAAGVLRVDLKRVKEENLLVGVKKLVLDEDGRLVEIVMFDKVAALTAIAKHHGLL